jgi:hypothetical protein
LHTKRIRPNERKISCCCLDPVFTPNAFKGPVAANTTEPCLLVSATTANFSFIGVSCIQKGLDPMKEKLAVVADTKRQGSVVLAATGIFDIATETSKYFLILGLIIYMSFLCGISNNLDPNPSMRKYLEVSVAISKIALRYIAPEDLHQYSVDEFFPIPIEQLMPVSSLISNCNF